MPNIARFEEERKVTSIALQKFQQSLNSQKKNVESQMSIIARYDEIMCEKANKQALNELKLEVISKLDEFNLMYK